MVASATDFHPTSDMALVGCSMTPSENLQGYRELAEEFTRLREGYLTMRMDEKNPVEVSKITHDLDKCIMIGERCNKMIKVLESFIAKCDAAGLDPEVVPISEVLGDNWRENAGVFEMGMDLNIPR